MTPSRPSTRAGCWVRCCPRHGLASSSTRRRAGTTPRLRQRRHADRRPRGRGHERSPDIDTRRGPPRWHPRAAADRDHGRRMGVDFVDAPPARSWCRCTTTTTRCSGPRWATSSSAPVPPASPPGCAAPSAVGPSASTRASSAEAPGTANRPAPGRGRAGGAAGGPGSGLRLRADLVHSRLTLGLRPLPALSEAVSLTSCAASAAVSLTLSTTSCATDFAWSTTGWPCSLAASTT